MSPSATTLLEQAHRLSEEEREWLATELSATLMPAMTPEQEAAVLELLESRRADYLAGRGDSIPAEEVFAQARAMLAKHTAASPP